MEQIFGQLLGNQLLDQGFEQSGYLLQAAGDCVVTPYENGVAQDTLTETMTAEKTNETVIRHLLNIKHIDEHMSVKFANAVVGQELSLIDMIISSNESEDQ